MGLDVSFNIFATFNFCKGEVIDFFKMMGETYELDFSQHIYSLKTVFNSLEIYFHLFSLSFITETKSEWSFLIGL